MCRKTKRPKRRQECQKTYHQVLITFHRSFHKLIFKKFYAGASDCLRMFQAALSTTITQFVFNWINSSARNEFLMNATATTQKGTLRLPLIRQTTTTTAKVIYYSVRFRNKFLFYFMIFISSTSFFLCTRNCPLFWCPPSVRFTIY